MEQDQHRFELASDDRIFLGEGLFETIKINHSKPCFYELHWQRLTRSAQNLGIPFLLSVAEWRNALLQKIQYDKMAQGGLKVILSGGRAPRGLTAQGEQSTLLLHSFTYPKQKKSLRVLSASWIRDEKNPLYQLKTLNYLEAITARRRAEEQGADDVFFFNTKSHLMEATCANVFLLYEGRLLTPPQEDGVLPGITRLRIMKHCAELAIPCKELSISLKMIKASDAVFLTNTLQGIQYVSSVDGKKFAVTHPTIELLIRFLAEEELGYVSG
jgi:4-amino-4-deoxychorismate lyase